MKQMITNNQRKNARLANAKEEKQQKEVLYSL